MARAQSQYLVHGLVRVLHLEPDSQLRESFCTLFSAMTNLEFRAAGTVKESESLLGDFWPDVFMFEPALPPECQQGLVRLVEDSGVLCNVPMILLSKLATNPLAVHKSVGAHLVKPQSLTTIFDAIRDVADGKRWSEPIETVRQ